MVCRNYTNLVSQCDLLFLSVVLRHTNCPSTWRQYHNRSPTNPNPCKLQAMEDFIKATNTVQIPDDYKLVSFDLKSLFTSIPLQLALQWTKNAIVQSTDPLPLLTEDIMDLLNFCLTSTYFQYNGKHHKQLHRTAVRSPVSVVVAEIVMQSIEESALRLAEISQLDWLNTNERQGRVMSTITLLKCETYEPHYRLGLCAMPNLQHQLISTTDLGKLVY